MQFGVQMALYTADEGCWDVDRILSDKHAL